MAGSPRILVEAAHMAGGGGPIWCPWPAGGDARGRLGASRSGACGRWGAAPVAGGGGPRGRSGRPDLAHVAGGGWRSAGPGGGAPPGLGRGLEVRCGQVRGLELFHRGGGRGERVGLRRRWRKEVGLREEWWMDRGA